MRRVLATFRRDTRGVATLELALIAPVLGFLMLGSVDLARAVATKIALEQAANRVVALAEVVHPSDTSSVEYLNAQARQEARATLGVDPAVTTRIYLTKCGTRTVQPSDTCQPSESPVRQMEVTVSGVHRTMFGAIARKWADANGNVPITAKANVRLQ